VEGCEQAIGLSIKEELDDFRTRAAHQHMVKFMDRGANNLSPRRFGIAGLTQKVNEAVDPLGIAGVEANGSNPMPRT
jgi:hypothetical protein